MTPIKNKTIPNNSQPDLFHLLEFDTLLQHIEKYCYSSPAQRHLTKTVCSTTTREIEAQLQRVIELKDMLLHDKPLPLWHFEDIGQELNHSAVAGSHLSVEALIKIYTQLDLARQLSSYLKAREASFPEIARTASRLCILRVLEQEIAAKIDFDQVAVKDGASPKLKQLRRQIAQQEGRVHAAVEKVFEQCNQKGLLQEPVISLSNGRLVLPVKSEHKNKVRGIIHDQSSSGATTYIEPIESFEINNQIRLLRLEEKHEVERILTEITTQIAGRSHEIAENQDVLTEIDVLHAKAKFSIAYDCHKPALNEHNQLEIHQGRHPLLLIHKKDAAEVVPLNLTLKDPVKTLIITGPNAGGKSVTLKTIGLFCLMVQSGIPIPAGADSNLPVFESIFTDIGDYQSIEHDLSTFSSHINRIKTIVEHATERSLVLIDEIGTGTDPDEGAALARALLETLTRKGCLTVVTTHLGALKLFAYEADAIENGSMEFDMQTLQPAYRFRLGLPGSSYALEISKRLGLPAQILTRARKLLGDDKLKLDQLILDMERKLQSSEKLAQQLEIEKDRLQGLTQLYKQRYEALQKQERQFKEKALQESEEIIRASNALIEKTIKEIREQQASRDAIKRAKEALAHQTQKIAAQKAKLSAPEKSVGTPVLSPEQLKPGMTVLWDKQNVSGEIVSVSEQGRKALLQIDQFKFWVPAEELRASTRPKSRRTETVAAASRVEIKKDVLPELDIRGERLDDALSKVDKFLDDAILAGWQEVRIIHGKGTGVLRKGIAGFLAVDARVLEHKMAAWNEGDMGVTIVTLK